MARKDISIANFNLLNLNLPGQPIYDDAGWTQAQYDAKIAFSERVLDDIDADIIGFQECWNAVALAEIFDRPALRGR